LRRTPLCCGAAITVVKASTLPATPLKTPHTEKAEHETALFPVRGQFHQPFIKALWNWDLTVLVFSFKTVHPVTWMVHVNFVSVDSIL
jgi:hypothetical protein